ncbi:hypothetical protein CR513_27380, partial [Mucuna pruriens]
MEMKLNDSFHIVHLNSLLVEFGQFQEGRLKKVKGNFIHLTTHDRASTNKDKSKVQLKIVHKDYFYKHNDHFKNDCSKRKKCFEKKGIYYISIESNLIEVPNNTWWLDFGATTHALILDIGCHVDLEGYLYIPRYARNLVSISKLDDLGWRQCKVGDNVFSLCKDMYCYGSSTLIDDLYCFNLDAKFTKSLFNVECVGGSKHNVHDDSSTYLWKQRLSHIYIKRIMRLMKIIILSQLDFDCIKGKQTKQIPKNFTRNNNLLGLIHTDICGSFDSQLVNILKLFTNEVEMQLVRKVKVVRQCPSPFAKFLES